MHRYAQTNLQLYAQLGAAGWTEPQLALVASGYELAMEICGASFRPNGKPFMCHLVGTASIVASWAAPVDEVVCGLLHSAYTHGAWADRGAGMTDARRAAVRQAVGEECEALVAAYTRLSWKPSAIEQWAGDPDSLSAGERVALRVRLANELEDHLDLGMQYSRKSTATSSPQAADSLLVLAERLVGPDFSDALAAAIGADADRTVPAVLVRADRKSFRSEPAQAASGRGGRA